MQPERIDAFFEALASHLRKPATVILTGAAAGSLLGHVRSSVDIDFAIRLTLSTATGWAAVEQAVSLTSRDTGITASYAEDIDRWSSVSLLDYRQHAKVYRRFGTLTVCILDPAYWSIGKIGRYLESDANDVAEVLRVQRVPLRRLLALWIRVLRESPPSTALTDFRYHAESFLRIFGRTVWGSRFNAQHAIESFRRQLAASRLRRQ